MERLVLALMRLEIIFSILSYGTDYIFIIYNMILGTSK
nr:MAG TPA: hypothetical protein [Caudoviricetes sp.]